MGITSTLCFNPLFFSLPLPFQFGIKNWKGVLATFVGYLVIFVLTVISYVSLMTRNMCICWLESSIYYYCIVACGRCAYCCKSDLSLTDFTYQSITQYTKKPTWVVMLLLLFWSFLSNRSLHFAFSVFFSHLSIFLLFFFPWHFFLSCRFSSMLGIGYLTLKVGMIFSDWFWYN